MIINLIGWLGAVTVILAYLLISLKKMTSDSFMYQGLNLVGAILLVINTIYLAAYPSAFVNIIWSIIAIVGLIKKK